MSNEKEVLIVDDKIDNIKLLNSFLENEPYRLRNALDANTALKSIKLRIPDIILLDIDMPQINGFELCKILKADAKTEHIPIIFVSALNDIDTKIEAFRIGGVDYIVKPFASAEVIARVKTHLELVDYQHNLESMVEEGVQEIRMLNKEIEETQDEMIVTLASILDARDDDTGKHVVRVAEFSKTLAQLYGLDEREVELIYKAAPLHDAGKVAIPDQILNKPGQLDPQEREIMKTHAIKGYELFKDSKRPILKMAGIIAKEHHEQWSGGGYPDGLKGEEIHIAGRIVLLADIFDALTHKRVYKNAWSFEQALEFIQDNSGTIFEPRLVELFGEHFDTFIALHKDIGD